MAPLLALAVTTIASGVEAYMLTGDLAQACAISFGVCGLVYALMPYKIIYR